VLVTSWALLTSKDNQNGIVWEKELLGYSQMLTRSTSRTSATTSVISLKAAFKSPWSIVLLLASATNA
jgi:hypothetical protein